VALGRDFCPKETKKEAGCLIAILLSMSESMLKVELKPATVAKVRKKLLNEFQVLEYN